MSAPDRGLRPPLSRQDPANAGSSPRLVLAGGAPVESGRAAVRPEHVERLAELLLRTQEKPCLEYVRELADQGLPLTRLVVDLLAPATRVVGAAWATDRVGFLEAGIAYGRVQQLLRRLSQEFDPGPADLVRAGRVLLTVPEGETHTLGLFALAELLLRDQWEVVLCRPVLETNPSTLVHSEWFDAVLVSAAQERMMPGIAQEIGRLRQRSRNPDLRVLVGGNLATLVPEVAERTGADVAGGEADVVSQRLAQTLSGTP